MGLERMEELIRMEGRNFFEGVYFFEGNVWRFIFGARDWGGGVERRD